MNTSAAASSATILRNSRAASPLARQRTKSCSGRSCQERKSEALEISVSRMNSSIRSRFLALSSVLVIFLAVFDFVACILTSLLDGRRQVPHVVLGRALDLGQEFLRQREASRIDHRPRRFHLNISAIDWLTRLLCMPAWITGASLGATE